MALHGTPGNTDANLVQFRIERGATAMGTDGALGSVEQIVVDRDSGELRALIVLSSVGDGEFELPASHVTRATGDHVYLDIGRSDLATHPDLANPYDPQQYVPVYQGSGTPVGQATRTAISTEHPVVTGVEENAAELVAPEAMMPGEGLSDGGGDTAPLPSRTASAVRGDEPTSQTTWGPRTSAAEATQPLHDTAVGRPTSTPTTPTESAARTDSAVGPAQPAVQTGPAIGESGTEAPGRGVSATLESTGPLMGGLPSTGGMGEKATVPNTDSEPYNMRLDEEKNAERASSEAGLLQAFREAGSEPASIPDDQLRAAQADDEVLERDGLDMVRPMESVAPEVTAAEVTAPPASPSTTPPAGNAAVGEARPPTMSGTVPAGRQLPAPTLGSRLTAQLTALPTDIPPTALLGAAGLGAGIGMGILLRQRNRRAKQAQRQAREAARNAKRALLESGGQAQGSVADAAASVKALSQQATTTAKDTGKQARRTAKRMARRGRWFRRGLALGFTTALLFAPKPGADLRQQLATTLDEWRSRIA